jgi:hypothetical protein
MLNSFDIEFPMLKFRKSMSLGAWHRDKEHQRLPDGRDLEEFSGRAQWPRFPRKPPVLRNATGIPKRDPGFASSRKDLWFLDYERLCCVQESPRTLPTENTHLSPEIRKRL